MFECRIADFVPYKDKKVLNRVRDLHGEALTKHANPDFKINIVSSPGMVWAADMIARIQRSDLEDKKLVMILPNPCPGIYENVAAAINGLRINCRNVYVFTMDEWADENGHIAPPDYKSGFTYSQLKYFYGKIDADLRMPLTNIRYPTTKNISAYSAMITDCGNGGADICYSGPGWAGHIAFIDPLTPEFSDDLDEFLKQDARVVTLNPMTIMQNSLHGVFGQSGDIASVPPRAATIGPADVKRAKNRMESHDLVTGGSFSSWQRMISRLILHGEVTPLVPASILQLMKTKVYVSDAIAAPIECMERTGY
jgi:6-phosphogluconolactonase/glucosamine-6-phosphate isomerase/deaminase